MVSFAAIGRVDQLHALDRGAAIVVVLVHVALHPHLVPLCALLRHGLSRSSSLLLPLRKLRLVKPLAEAALALAAYMAFLAESVDPAVWE